MLNFLVLMKSIINSQHTPESIFICVGKYYFTISDIFLYYGEFLYMKKNSKNGELKWSRPISLCNCVNLHFSIHHRISPIGKKYHKIFEVALTYVNHTRFSSLTILKKFIRITYSVQQTSLVSSLFKRVTINNKISQKILTKI